MIPPRGNRPKKLKIALATAVVLFTGILVAVFVGYRLLTKSPETVLRKLGKNVNLSLGSIRHTATRDGVREWTLSAKTAQLVESEHHMLLEELTVVYHLENGEEVYLKGEKGVLDTRANDIEVTGNVVLIHNPYELRTQRLKYYHNKRKIVSDAPVDIISDTLHLGADAMAFDIDTRKAIFNGNVEGIIHEKPRL